MLACKHLRLTTTLSAWTRRSIIMTAVRQEDMEYQRSVAALNSLQTNASVLEQVRQERRAKGRQQSAEMNKMLQYLERTGLKVEDLDRMNSIHVTGTKGKGSVCAMTESILRAHGLKTGFYSSPHLLEVRERIRINGRPLSKVQFASYFWDCHNKLSSTKEQYGGTMPAYFRFLTVMAFNVFLQEKVDVAVVEVGIGGTYDSTNIMPNPLVSAITSLGYDHVDILGDTLAKIAWQKGGICKPGHPAFTIPQLAEPLKMLSERAKELKASSFHVVPELSEYPGECPASHFVNSQFIDIDQAGVDRDTGGLIIISEWSFNPPELGLPGEHQRINASLAVQVCRAWLQEVRKWGKMNGTAHNVERTREGVPVADPFYLPPEFHEGLRLCRWLGRSQAIRRQGVTYFLDGAHTPNSVKASAEWFVKAAGEEAQTIIFGRKAWEDFMNTMQFHHGCHWKHWGSVVRVLLFNLTGRRDNRALIEPLMACDVHCAVFCPNIADSSHTNTADQTNLMVTLDDQYARSKAIEQTWLQLHAEKQLLTGGTKLTNQSGPGGHVTLPRTAVFTCINHALHWITSGHDPSLPLLHNETPTSTHAPPLDIAKATHIQLLVTGSLHLVGAVMNVMGYTADDV